ncbi:DUF6602 domain-containing protein [Klebsiella aerogenes]|uniref:DUF6602 domain-containing protein n=1 Tax=Klebsiella aerogenes TaxID=548 RepID=UPI0005F0200A|nr:DUF6602 domain-containing protein [Klebsiella aerogenes]KJO38990.1 hypothetical protein SR83_24270 [Klebsiella aerogenes]KJO39261.1 hypothetical protein SR82_24150 [Klebsiella aerogenes]KJO40565.1 hypothetical protein SR85_21945 [Klebsiella aerogenes]
MVNNMLYKRLTGVLQVLNASHIAGSDDPSAVKGEARSKFINNYLTSAIPNGLRISTSGVIIDNQNNNTGELDIIIENGFFPNIPYADVDSARLFFAEGVAAVIEVKSNLSGQWNEAISTGKKLHEITRDFSNSTVSNIGGGNTIILDVVTDNPDLPIITPSPQFKMLKKIPYFVVGYRGWENIESLRNKIDESNGVVSAILQLDKGFFVSDNMFQLITHQGPLSLLAFINAIYESYSYIKSTDADILSYARD